MPGGIDMSPRVLVVEDDAAIAELLRYNLEAEGYLSTVVGSGEEAELQVAEDVYYLVHGVPLADDRPKGDDTASTLVRKE